MRMLEAKMKTAEAVFLFCFCSKNFLKPHADVIVGADHSVIYIYEAVSFSVVVAPRIRAALSRGVNILSHTILAARPTMLARYWVI